MVDWFEPYMVEMNQVRPGLRFLVGTKQAKDWYDPLPEHYRLELAWLVRKLDELEMYMGSTLVDAGCHHGLYLTALGGGAYTYRGRTIGVDLHGPNLALAEANCALNGIRAKLYHAAILDQEGWVTYNGQALGAVVEGGPVAVPATTLKRLAPEADVVKLDIEGAEYQVLPGAVREMETVRMWIVEFHPWYEFDGKSAEETLKDGIGLFMDGRWDTWWLDREDGKGFQEIGTVERFYHGTLCAVRKEDHG